MNDLKSTILRFLKYLVTEQKPNKPTQPTSVNSGDASNPQPSSTITDAFVVPVRETPVGTKLIRKSGEEATMTVQAAIQYWCIAAPIACLLSIFVSVPIGGMIGYNVSFDQYNRLVGDVFSNFFWGGFWGAALSLVAAGTAYSMTRPIVRVVVDKDYVRFGSYKFDRRFASGMRIGYSSDDVELSKTVTQPRFGVTVLRFGYGPWGEDMKYMVNAHYASDICNWMNEVIDSVGAPKPKENDAQEGRKLELL